MPPSFTFESRHPSTPATPFLSRKTQRPVKLKTAYRNALISYLRSDLKVQRKDLKGEVGGIPRDSGPLRKGVRLKVRRGRAGRAIRLQIANKKDYSGWVPAYEEAVRRGSVRSQGSPT